MPKTIVAAVATVMIAIVSFTIPLRLARITSVRAFSSLSSPPLFGVTRYHDTSMRSPGDHQRHPLITPPHHLMSTSSFSGIPMWNRQSKKSEKRTPKLYSRNNKMKDEYRADRVLANRSGKSRSECFDLLQKRRVFYQEEVGATSMERAKPIWKVVPGPKHKLTMSTPLKVDSTLIPLPPPLLLAYHKPKWVLSVRSDPHGRPCLDFNTFRVTHPIGIEGDGGDSNPLDEIDDSVDLRNNHLHPVGRLDYDSSGLLLFSSDGGLTQLLLHPKHDITKEYTAIVTGCVKEDELRDALASGVTTGEGVHYAKLLSSHAWEASQVAPYLREVKAALPREYNQTDLKVKGYLDVLEAGELSTVTLEVDEGKHRMVRRMLANLGHPVVDLRRNRMGSIELGDLPVGCVRYLTNEELAWAKNLLQSKNG